MNKNILSKNVQDFIDENLFIDTFKFLLKKNVFKKVSNKEIIVQIQSKSKAKDKILKSRPPLLFHNNKIDNLKTGNINDNFDNVKDADWIIEQLLKELI